MKTKFFAMAAFAALTMAGMTSCSDNDELTGQNQVPVAHQGAIGFNVTQDGALATRGTATTAANFLAQISNFQVFGYFSDGSGRYVGTADTEGTVIDGDGAGNWTYNDDTKTQYWPGANLDFQAITPASDASFTLANTPDAGSPRLTANVTVPAAVASQKDIMFASATGVDNSSTGTAVGLTFKHALTQVVFAGKVAKPTIKAEVASIELVNIHNTGNVGYRTAVATLGAEASGDAASTFALGLVADPKIPETATADAVNLTATDGALMMIPQAVAKWTTTKKIDGTGTAVSIADANTAHNAYLKIKCTVTDVNTNVNLIDNDFVYIPFEVSWDQGKKYTYTLVFGNGSGGFDEDGNPLTSMVPITYTVTAADDWTPVDGGEIAF